MVLVVVVGGGGVIERSGLLQNVTSERGLLEGGV